MNEIEIVNASTHNLKNISLNIPRHKFVVVTGPSGSGKSSLAFDTIFQEGQRRYLESLTSFGSPFMQQLNPVSVESIKGLSPTLSLDQKTTITNNRSTVGTVTEIYDYLRILFSKCAIAHSPDSNLPINARSHTEIIEDILDKASNKKVIILYQAIKDQKGAHREVLASAESLGYNHFRINGVFYSSDEKIEINKHQVNSIEVVVDRIIVTKDKVDRLTRAIQEALRLGKGTLSVSLVDEKKELYYSDRYYCPVSKKNYPPPHPIIFSFNSDRGRCLNCLGHGFLEAVDNDKILESLDLPLLEQPRLRSYLEGDDALKTKLEVLLKKNKVDAEDALRKYPKTLVEILLNGNNSAANKFIGLNPYFSELLNDTEYEYGISSFVSPYTCQTCRGKRLQPYPLSFRYRETTIDVLVNMSLIDLLKFISAAKYQHQRGILREVEGKLQVEIRERLKFLIDVGLHYLTLDRTARSLSGGELQRIRLASQLGAQLSGVIYILDEPSIGLHQRDNLKLIQTLKNLRDMGNTIIVVEHDEETIRFADFVIDLGPGAGSHGGEILFSGSVDKLLKSNTPTANFLSGINRIDTPKTRKKPTGHIVLKNSSSHNLKNINCNFPLGCFVAVTGVSGSGKSTLIHDELVPRLKDLLFAKKAKNISVVDTKLNDLICIDQNPIGRTPKSIPASYCGIYDNIRQLFANTMTARMAQMTTSHFSFNVKNGRCPKCEGHGQLKFVMPYLSQSYITCPVCLGKRFNNQVLGIRYRGLTIDDVLNLTVEQACEFFVNHRKIHFTLKTLLDVGLGYIKLGQPSPTLSGGEAQRIKLSKELSKIKKGHVLYILDEPTTGLHFQDIKLLLASLDRLVDQGNSVLVIEHNLDLIKCADYIIDLGPEGGDGGGKIVAEGTPEEIVKNKNSETAKFLKQILAKKH